MCDDGGTPQALKQLDLRRPCVSGRVQRKGGYIVVLELQRLSVCFSARTDTRFMFVSISPHAGTLPKRLAAPLVPAAVYCSV